LTVKGFFARQWRHGLQHRRELIEKLFRDNPGAGAGETLCAEANAGMRYTMAATAMIAEPFFLIPLDISRSVVLS
jgi:hypothetical protein